MSRRTRPENDLEELDELIEEITVDAYGDDEQLWAFRQAFEDNVDWPAAGSVIGVPVSVVEIDYEGDPRRGLTAICRREDGSRHVVAASDVAFPAGFQGARCLAAYRKWLNLDPWPGGGKAPPAQGKGKGKASSDSLDLSKPVELAVLAVKQRAARCRLLASDQEFTLRATGLWEVVPGEIATVAARKQWSYAGHAYLSGEIRSARLEVSALGLAPLRLEDVGTWDPEEENWGEDVQPLEERDKAIIARGPRPAFEMEQVLPGEDPEDPCSDPISKSNDLKEAGDWEGARKLLMEACQADLRCLDAHSHLGTLIFDSQPEQAIRHYEAGLRLGELSLGADFDGVLEWGCVDNRPFLRCMHGYGLCLWRLGRFEEAEATFERMLWLNPSDNQGARFLVDGVRAGKAWEDHLDDWLAIREADEGIMDNTQFFEESEESILKILFDDQADEADRILAAEAAGDWANVNDRLADGLLSVVGDGRQPEKLRGRAAIALGPVLEIAWAEEFADPDDVPISEQTFLRIQQELCKLYRDAGVPKQVRRRILEASVRAPEDWHRDAVAAAYSSGDDDWKLSAVFAMRWLDGFDEQILESLQSENEDIHYEAVCAAGNGELDAAWSHVARLVAAPETEKGLLLAAIEALANIRPRQAGPLLVDLSDSDDQDIAEAAYEAMSMAELHWELDEEDEGGEYIN